MSHDRLGLAVDEPSEPDPSGTLHRAFARQCDATPERVAIRSPRGALTYRELRGAAAQVAGELLARGVQPGATVGVLIARSLASMSAILGVISVGARWVPLDPAAPSPHHRFLIDDAGLSLLLCDAETAAQGRLLGAEALVVDPELGRRCAAPLPLLRPPLDDLHLLYTSGSTGRPKGVCGTHAMTLNRCAWMWRAFPFEAGEVLAHRTALSFCDSLWEMFGGLLRGVPTAVIEPDDSVDPLRLVAALADAGVTRITLLPSQVEVLLDAVPELAQRLPALRWIALSGETLPPQLARRLRVAMPHTQLLNLYGSTEVGADVTFARITGEEVGEVTPIGLPIDNAEVRLLDAEGRPVGVGQVGEIYVGGPVLARGYHARPGETALRFVPHPEVPGARLFRTGDQAWRDADGALYYVGRVDHQVKLRGVRVELEAVEHALRACEPALTAAAAVIHQDGDNALTRRLVAFVSPSTVSTARLQRALADRVPSPMVPARIFALDALPRTHTSKVDRRALAALRPRTSPAVPPERLPRGAVETVIAQLWSARFDQDPIPRDADFWSLGGDSLGWVSFAVELESLLEVSTSRAQLSPSQSLAALAERLEAQCPPGVAQPPAVTLAPLSPRWAEPVAQAMAAWFTRRDPTTVMLDIRADDYLSLAREIVASCPDPSLSTIALDGERLVGFCVCLDLCTPAAMGRDFPGRDVVIDLCDDRLLASYRAMQPELRFGQVFDLSMSATAPDVDGFLLVQAMETRSLEAAAAAGYQRAISVCTHRVTRYLARAMGFTEVLSLDYADYEFEGRRVFAELAPIHGGAVVVERALQPPRVVERAAAEARPVA